MGTAPIPDRAAPSAPLAARGIHHLRCGWTTEHYVYETRSGDDALLVALNIDDKPLQLVLPELGPARAEVVAGSAAPPGEVVDELTVEPHGWRILRPV